MTLSLAWSPWVQANIKSRVKEIFNLDTFKRDWLEFKRVDQRENLRFVYFSHNRNIPMTLPFISVKFTGRVSMGRVNTRTKEGKNILKMLGFESIPLYLVVTPEGNVEYGKHPGEYFNYDSVELYMRSLCPEVNDMFMFSLYLVNLCSLFEFFVRQGGLFRRLGKFLWILAKYNVVLLLLWLPLLGIFKLPFLQPCVSALLRLLRHLVLCPLASLVRQDILLGYYSPPVLVLTFLAYCLLIAVIQRKRTGGYEPDMETTAAPWWSLEASFAHPYSPFTSLTRPMTSQDLDLEEGMEMLLERLAVPDLWLHPLVPTEYVRSLPTWEYGASSPTGQCVMSHQACANLIMDSNYKCACNVGYDSTSKGPCITQVPIVASTECVVCLEAYELTALLCGLPCGHAFHQHCIMEWLTRYKHCCPVCRWPAYKPRLAPNHRHSD